jgi:hypothetical protein
MAASLEELGDGSGSGGDVEYVGWRWKPQPIHHRLAPVGVLAEAEDLGPALIGRANRSKEGSGELAASGHRPQV